MTTFIIATRNRHKTDEIREILGPRIQCRSLADFSGVPAVKEDAPTFRGNAEKKAVEIARWLRSSGAMLPDGTCVLADDSGLEVDALNGAPGVFSARFAALDATGDGNSPDVDNNAKLLRLLQDVPMARRSARFRCVLAVVALGDAGHAAEVEFYEGACEGRIAAAPRGGAGFGYDPLFIPAGMERSFAELGDAEKNKISHRAQALAKLAAHLANRR